MPRREPLADHLVVISLDALRPEYYLDERWPAPTMRQLLHEGAHAEAVRSVFPSSSYPGHATIVTGALPARHGIVYNRIFAPTGRAGRWFYQASSIRVPTLWDAAATAGRTSAAVGWPLTAGAPIDWNVPDIWPGGTEADALEAVRRATRPEGLWAEIEREATGRLRPETFDNRRIASAIRVGMIGAYLFERYRPALLLVHTQPTTQVMQDPGWWTDPRKQRAVAASDRAISEILETVKRLGLRERTAFMIVGDHGMRSVHTQLRPNVWLREAGLRPDHPEAGHWGATFHAQAGAAFLRVSEPVRANEDAVRRLLGDLSPGTRGFFRIVERDELDALGADPDAAFALSAAPGLEFSDVATGPAVRPNTGMTHGYLPDEPEMHTGFIGAGPGFCPGAVTPLLPLQDLAPLAASVLGLEFDAPDGALCPGLLDR
ncbi:MAG TPA: ectonucleotide pyrophosphatase/phosphodiesterase [Longimicrobiaceae bacterium]|nr:ectonucleotide pyrophosphatase/phosphodiesterase [Longimicrobiaceae bacterium]